MNEREQQQKQVEANSKVFAKQLPELLEKGLEGQYAIMRNGEIEAYLQDFNDAVVMGRKLFKGEPFSVQPITSHPINLGSYSYRHNH